MNQFSGRASIWVAFLCVKKFEAIRAGGLCGWFMFYVDSPVCFTYNFTAFFPDMRINIPKSQGIFDYRKTQRRSRNEGFGH